jgi:hypothetical protein
MFLQAFVTEEFFLPTLRSRMAIISAHSENDESSGKYKTFFKKTPGERLKIIEELLSAEDDAVRGEALMFLNEIEEVLSEIIRKEKKVKGDDITDTHEAITNARRFISKNQGSKKLLLEYIALTAPTV